MSRVQSFRDALRAFKDALMWIESKKPEIVQNKAYYAKIQANFKSKYEEPLDRVWKSLNLAEKRMCSVQWWLNADINEQEEFKKSKEVAEMFKGTIISIEEPVGWEE